MKHWVTSSLVMLVLVSISACGSKPRVAEPKPVVKSIAIIPALSPASYSVDGRLVMDSVNTRLGILFMDPKRGEKEKIFAQRLPDARLSLGPQLTNAVAQGLRDLGYRVEILQNVPRYPEDPDDVDYDKLSYTEDAVLHVYFRLAGIHSRPAGRNYVPHLNPGGRLMAKGYSKVLYRDTVYYGYEADPTDPATSIVADTKYRYADFDAVLGGLDSLRTAYQEGASAAGKLLATQVHNALK